jgi:hypothetical protein
MNMKAAPTATATASPKKDTLDRVAMFMSAVCLVHCTVLPLALVALQTYGAILVPKALDNEWFHAVMAIALFGVGGLAFVTGFLRHGQWKPLAAGALGTALLFLGAFNPGQNFSEFGEHAITVTGTLILLFAHTRNRRASHHLHPHTHGGVPCEGHH